MTTTLIDVEAAVRASWGRDTCDPDDVAGWTPQNPSRGQCGVTALVVQDLIGGDLVIAPVTKDGEPAGWHYWNRFAGGLDVDLTRSQFTPTEHLGEPKVVHRPPTGPRRCIEEYELLRSRVFTALGVAAPA